MMIQEQTEIGRSTSKGIDIGLLNRASEKVLKVHPNAQAFVFVPDREGRQFLIWIREETLLEVAMRQEKEEQLFQLQEEAKLLKDHRRKSRSLKKKLDRQHEVLKGLQDAIERNEQSVRDLFTMGDIVEYDGRRGEITYLAPTCAVIDFSPKSIEKFNSSIAYSKLIVIRKGEVKE